MNTSDTPCLMLLSLLAGTVCPGVCATALLPHLLRGYVHLLLTLCLLAMAPLPFARVGVPQMYVEALGLHLFPY